MQAAGPASDAAEDHDDQTDRHADAADPDHAPAEQRLQIRAHVGPREQHAGERQEDQSGHDQHQQRPPPACDGRHAAWGPAAGRDRARSSSAAPPPMRPGQPRSARLPGPRQRAYRRSPPVVRTARAADGMTGSPHWATAYLRLRRPACSMTSHSANAPAASPEQPDRRPEHHAHQSQQAPPGRDQSQCPAKSSSQQDPTVAFIRQQEPRERIEHHTDAGHECGADHQRPHPAAGSTPGTGPGRRRRRRSIVPRRCGPIRFRAPTEETALTPFATGMLGCRALP